MCARWRHWLDIQRWWFVVAFIHRRPWICSFIWAHLVDLKINFSRVRLIKLCEDPTKLLLPSTKSLAPHRCTPPHCLTACSSPTWFSWTAIQSVSATLVSLFCLRVKCPWIPAVITKLYSFPPSIAFGSNGLAMLVCTCYNGFVALYL